jgi:hypothetical protein
VASPCGGGAGVADPCGRGGPMWWTDVEKVSPLAEGQWWRTHVEEAGPRGGGRQTGVGLPPC